MFGLSPDLSLLLIAGLALTAALPLGYLLYRIYRHAGALDCWERTAWRLRLQFTGGDEPSYWRMAGKLHNFPVEVTVRTIETTPSSAPEKGRKKKKKKKSKPSVMGTTRVKVTIPTGFVPNATLRRRPGGAASSVSTGGLRTGDSKFDRRVDVRGDAAIMLAHLNETARAKALDAIPTLGAVVEKNRIQCDIGGIVKNPRVLSHAIKSLVSLASALKGNGESVEHNLLMNCLRDTNKEVRNVSFSTLLTRYQYKSETLRAATAILGPRDPITEMVGGMQAGIGGIERVRQSALDERLPLEMRVRCIEHLVTEFPERIGPMLRDLVAPLAIQLKEKEATRMIGLLAQIDGSVGQYALLPFLSAHSLNVQVGALVTLGGVGDDEVVPNIQAMIDESYTDGKVKVIAKQTIAAIRSRALNLANT